MNDQAKFPRHDTGALQKQKARENETPEQRIGFVIGYFILFIYYVFVSFTKNNK